jgi:SSS family solute:Na+ symporter
LQCEDSAICKPFNFQGVSVTLSSIDLVIVGVYLVAVLWLGLKLSKKDASKDSDFFVAGRSLGWFAIGASLFASNISSEHLIGLSADGFRTGLAVGNYEWGAVIVLIILALVFVPFYVGTHIQTIPEFLEKRFGPGSRMYLSILTIVANVLVRISVALYAGGLVIEQMFGIPFWPAILILTVITATYTAVGGLKAVVLTDSIQTVILLAGTIILTAIALDKVGGWSGLQAGLDESMFSMVKPASDPEMPWHGLLLGVPILGIWYWCTDQVIVQRVLGAKNIAQAQYGALFAAFLKILPVFLLVLPGLCGRVLFPEIEAKNVFPVLVQNLLPVGAKGLVAAALIAALMSSIDSTLNSTSTLFALDIFKRFKPEASDKTLLKVGRITTFVVVVFGILWVVVVAKAGSLFQYLQQVQAALSPPIAASFLIGVFWTRANHKGVMTALVTGLIMGISFVVAGVFIEGFMPFLISAAITFAVSVVILVVVSLLTEPPKQSQIDGLTWPFAKSLLEGEPSYQRAKKPVMIMASVLIVAMISLWISFA